MVAAVRDENVTLLAAGIAYYAFVSLVPLLLLALGIASLVGGPALADRVVAAAGEFLTPTAEALVRDSLVANAATGSATLVGLAVLTWSALKLFRALHKAFTEVYGGEGGRGLLAEVRDGLVVLGAVGLGSAGVGLAGGAVTQLFGGFGVVAPAISLTALVAAFLPLYYVFPTVPMTLRTALPGTLVAAVGWTALGSGFGIYAAVAGGSVYGVLGAALLVVTWLYLGGLLVLVGAVVNATLAGEMDLGVGVDRQVQQARPSAPGTSMPDDGEEVEREPEDGAGAGEAGPTEPKPEPEPEPEEPRRGVDSESDSDSEPEEFDPGPRTDAETAEEIAAMQTDLERLREQLDETERRLEEKTVSRSDLEGDLRQYVRARVRRGHARGWGPYLVLLYGTLMTLGAFFYLEGIWAITAMLVLWLSTLGLYVLMILVGMGVGLLGGLGKARDVVGKLRR